ncbi:MAG: hypothetical protein AAF718_14295 [Pseudomonadota bacterium]
MREKALPVLVTVLAGTFTNQAAAFFVLKSEAARLGIDLDPRETDVIREAPEVRLAHYFRPAIVAKIQEAMAEDNTTILLFPSPLTALPTFPVEQSEMRLVGRFAGLVEHPL